MTVHIENETEEQFQFDYEELIRSVIGAALEYEACPYDAEVEIVLTDNAGIHEINLQQRNIDRPTDVLSFPMAEYETPADFDGLEAQEDVYDPDSGEYMMGDIMISMDKVKEQADLYGHSEKRELGFLVAHSMLHLMGYDHMEDAERLVMEKRQEEILNSIGLTR